MATCNSQSNHRQVNETIPLDQIYELLADWSRRSALYCLYLNENPVKLSAVAQQIATWNHPHSDYRERRERVYTQLYHCHVPKLCDADIIRYDPAEDSVSLAENAREIRPYIERAAEDELNTNERYGL
ncbi:DUF7344 domain-containing protein [Halobellus salinisoli]|uniref:DUF7344 domain-containing protein n=1 Tax=Halobellus salinisoli TaxID=3108500 RepID=UPI00300916CE